MPGEAGDLQRRALGGDLLHPGAAVLLGGGGGVGAALQQQPGGLEVPLARREVPSDNSCLGELGLASEPSVEQIFIDGCGLTGELLERKLYMARKRAERLVAEKLGPDGAEFYIISMSSRTPPDARP